MNILFIDHDELWLNKMVEEIAGAIATSTMKPIGETHIIKTIVVDPEPQDTLKNRSIAQMRALDFKADLILVDLSFDNKNRDGSIQIGRRLAQGLREEFRELAVGVYSRFELSPRDKGLISSDRFALRLDEVRKMYEHLKDPMTGDDWNDVFEGVQRKSAEESSRLPLSFTTTPPENFVWADGHPYSRSTGFERVSRRLVANSLSFLELSEKTRVEISQLSGGFFRVIFSESESREWRFVCRQD